MDEEKKYLLTVIQLYQIPDTCKLQFFLGYSPKSKNLTWPLVFHAAKAINKLKKCRNESSFLSFSP